MIHFMVMFNRQRKLRFERWFNAPNEDRRKYLDGLMCDILLRNPKCSNFLDYRSQKIVYKRYASLFFACGIDDDDNELLHLEIIHRFVEILDEYFGTVCELDVVFNFDKVNFLFDEFILAGEMVEPSKGEILRAINVQDRSQENDAPKKSLFRKNCIV